MTALYQGLTREAFRGVMRCFPTGVTVLTAMTEDGPRGMTANAVTSLSLEPLLILACVQQGSRFAGTLAEVDAFAVNVLTERQSGEAGWFASPSRFRMRGPRGEFAGFGWRRSAHTAVPLLAGTAAYLDCRIVDRMPRGDHVIVFGEVMDCAADLAARPLVWFGGTYSRIDTL